MISPEEVRNVIEQGEIIEDYPNDQRGLSCLMFCYSIGDRPLHVICAAKGELIGIEILGASAFIRDSVLDSVQAKVLDLAEAKMV